MITFTKNEGKTKETFLVLSVYEPDLGRLEERFWPSLYLYKVVDKAVKQDDEVNPMPTFKIERVE